ncbi:hypothetical protein [Streptomyces sp. NRRL B-24484]|uniref:hypothetical protein n=1 Tax=Streptomyces sp. NRRL B-24484 TaxID=1463833 RepID=UPI0004C2AECE|nr:hypothetical protein [Streptomyces sp. NRRL B-24484]
MPETNKKIMNHTRTSPQKEKHRMATELQKQQDRARMKVTVVGGLLAIVAAMINAGGSEVIHHFYPEKPETVNSTISHPKQ